MSTRRAARVARGREALASPASDGTVPPELRRFRYTDWVHTVAEDPDVLAAEHARRYGSDGTPVPKAERAFLESALRALGSWRTAQDAWAAAHGHSLASPEGLERFRDACSLADSADARARGQL